MCSVKVPHGGRRWLLFCLDVARSVLMMIFICKSHSSAAEYCRDRSLSLFAEIDS